MVKNMLNVKSKECDENNRPIHIVYENGCEEFFQYDENGKVIYKRNIPPYDLRLKDGEYDYNKFGMCTKHIASLQDCDIYRTYYKNGKWEEHIYFHNGYAITNVYDKDGRVIYSGIDNILDDRNPKCKLSSYYSYNAEYNVHWEKIGYINGHKILITHTPKGDVLHLGYDNDRVTMKTEKSNLAITVKEINK